MSFAVTAIVAVAAGTYMQIDQGNKARKAQESAQNQARADAEENARQQDMAYNKANGKKPDLGAMLAGNKGAAGGGTMLTGAMGVDPNALSLSKTTLLGG